MKRRLTKVLSVMLAMFVAFGIVCVGTGEANAASGPLKLDKTSFWVGDNVYRSPDVRPSSDDDWDKMNTYFNGAKLVSVVSSNPGILKVGRDGGKSLYDYYLVPKKIGKSKITVKYKYKGHTYAMSRTYAVKKYPNPYKSIKVNGKAVKVSKHKFDYDLTKYKKTAAKVKITPKAGWVIDNVYILYYNNKTESDKFKQLKPAIIKKGKTIKVPANNDAYLFAKIRNTKNGDTIDYAVRFYRNAN